MRRPRFSLRQILTIPYVLLTLAVAAIIGSLSYAAGSQAVSALSEELLGDMVTRVSQAVDRHMSGSRVVLDAAFPEGMRAPASLAAASENLRERMWVAVSLNPEPNNYVYYGNAAGQYLGVVRDADGSGQWRWGASPDTPRRFHRFAGWGKPLDAGVLEQSFYDPRERPWYRQAMRVGGPAWSPVYVDNRTGELVATRVKPVRDERGAVAGIAATDVSLKHLDDFMRALRVSEHGVAFVAERNGDLIASSAGNSMRLSLGERSRLNAAHNDNPLVRATYAEMRQVVDSAGDAPHTRVFESESVNGRVYASARRIRDDAGLDWIVVVAVPRVDFMARVVDNVMRSAIVGVAAAVLAIALGLFILDWVSHDLRLLSRAVRRLGEGQLYAPVGIVRNDELGELARNFEAMHMSLQIDGLTGVFNRETFEKQLLRRIEEHHAGVRRVNFTLLFVDLDRFKEINDQRGHLIGDQVLTEMGRRLRRSLRPGDIVGRYGGDEFVVLLEIFEREVAETVRAKLEQRVREPLEALGGASQGDTACMSASVGFAFFPEDGADAYSLLRHADQDMYARKFAGRGGGAQVSRPSLTSVVQSPSAPVSWLTPPARPASVT